MGVGGGDAVASQTQGLGGLSSPSLPRPNRFVTSPTVFAKCNSAHWPKLRHAQEYVESDLGGKK